MKNESPFLVARNLFPHPGRINFSRFLKFIPSPDTRFCTSSAERQKIKTSGDKTQGEEQKDVGEGSISLSFSKPLPLPAAPHMCGGPRVRRADCPLVHLVLEDVEVVGGGYGDDVLVWVPRGVEDLLAEV